MLLAGIEIGGTKIQVVVGVATGRIIARRVFGVDRGAGAAGIRRQILEGLGELRSKHRFSAIGIGFGGPIDWRTGRVAKSHHIGGWEGFPLAGWLRSRFRVPVRADNDANVAVLAEAIVGVGKGRDPVFYLTIGSGIGGGIVREGRIYHGRYPGEVEIGHTRVPRPDLRPARWPILEDLCSGWSLDRQIRSIARSKPRSFFARLIGKHGPGKEARFLAEALRRRDPEAVRVWNGLCRHLALGLSHIVHLFHPEILVLGGGVTHLGTRLIHDLRRSLDPIVMAAHQGTFRVCLTELGEDVVPTGALLLAAEGLRCRKGGLTGRPGCA